VHHRSIRLPIAVAITLVVFANSPASRAAGPAALHAPVLRATAATVAPDEDFMWRVNLVIRNPTARGIYLDSLLLEVEPDTPIQQRSSRTSVERFDRIVRLVDGLAPGDSTSVQLVTQAGAEHATLTLRLGARDAQRNVYRAFTTVRAEPGRFSRAHPSVLVRVNGRAVETVLVPAASVAEGDAAGREESRGQAEGGGVAGGRAPGDEGPGGEPAGGEEAPAGDTRAGAALGSVAPDSSGRAPGVLLVHGHGASARTMLAMARVLSRRGFAVMLVSMPGYGGSEGPPDFMGPATLAAASAALDRLGASPGVDPARLGAWGLSRGATVVAELAARRRDLRAVVAQGGIYDLWAEARDTRVAGIRGVIESEAGRDSAAWGERSPILRAGRVRGAVLLLHGERDPNVPIAQARAFEAALRAAGADVEATYYSGSGHALPRAPSNRTALDFLRRRLGG
jgi:dienelactone hydrolase